MGVPAADGQAGLSSVARNRVATFGPFAAKYGSRTGHSIGDQSPREREGLVLLVPRFVLGVARDDLVAGWYLERGAAGEGLRPGGWDGPVAGEVHGDRPAGSAGLDGHDRRA